MKVEKLPRNTKENIRLAKVARQLSDLKKLRQLMEENQDNETVLNLLAEASFMPLNLLEDLKVPRALAEAFLIYNPGLTPEVIEFFREPKEGGRKFWE